jgi:hypothetical protein
MGHRVGHAGARRARGGRVLLVVSDMKHIETEKERQIRLSPEMAQLIKDTRSYIRIAAPVLGDRRTAETDAFQIRIDEMLLRLGGAEGFEW